MPPQVRLHSLLFAAPEDGRAPKSVKLFANRDNLDFDGAKDATADHEFTFEDASSFGQRLEVSAAQPVACARVSAVASPATLGPCAPLPRPSAERLR